MNTPPPLGLYCYLYQGAWLRIYIWQEAGKVRQAEILTVEEIGQLCGGN